MTERRTGLLPSTDAVELAPTAASLPDAPSKELLLSSSSTCPTSPSSIVSTSTFLSSSSSSLSVGGTRFAGESRETSATLGEIREPSCVSGESREPSAASGRNSVDVRLLTGVKADAYPAGPLGSGVSLSSCLPDLSESMLPLTLLPGLCMPGNSHSGTVGSSTGGGWRSVVDRPRCFAQMSSYGGKKDSWSAGGQPGGVTGGSLKPPAEVVTGDGRGGLQ